MQLRWQFYRAVVASMAAILHKRWLTWAKTVASRPRRHWRPPEAPHPPRGFFIPMNSIHSSEVDYIFSFPVNLVFWRFYHEPNFDLSKRELQVKNVGGLDRRVRDTDSVSPLMSPAKRSLFNCEILRGAWRVSLYTKILFKFKCQFQSYRIRI